MWQEVAVPILGLACALLAFFLYDARFHINSYLKEEIHQAERRAHVSREERISRALINVEDVRADFESRDNCLHDPHCRVVTEEYRGPYKVRSERCSQCGRQLSVTWPTDEEA